MTNNSEARMNQAWWVLRIGLGMMALLAGADKFTNLLTNWEMYLSPLVPRLTHLAPATFLHLAGIVEMLAGVVVLSGRATRVGAYVVMLWLGGIALNLALQGAFFDIAVRDLELALGAFALARLSEARAAVAVPEARSSLCGEQFRAAA